MNLEKHSITFTVRHESERLSKLQMHAQNKIQNFSFTCIMVTLDGDMTVTFSVTASLLLQFSK